MPSPRFIELAERVTALEHYFLAGQLTQNSVAFADEEQERLRAFRVLCHAEVQSALEDIASAAADAAIQRWLTHRRPRRVVVALVLDNEGTRLFEYWDGHLTPSVSIGRPLLPQGLTNPAGAADAAADAVQRALGAYRRMLRANSGLKE